MFEKKKKKKKNTPVRQSEKKKPSKTPICSFLDQFYSGALFDLPASCVRRRCRTFRASFSSPSSTVTYVVGSSRRSCPSTIHTLYRDGTVSAALSSNLGDGCAFALQYSAPPRQQLLTNLAQRARKTHRLTRPWMNTSRWWVQAQAQA